MVIDWFTVGAQALNFFILVCLMKRFLYKPIINAIDEREKKIATELSDASSQKAEAKKDRDDFQHKSDDFEKHRAQLLSEATRQAESERQRLIALVNKEADGLRSGRAESLANETRNLNQLISRRTQEQVFNIARKVLSELAGSSLEEHVCQVFIAQLKSIESAPRAQFNAALHTGKETGLIRSAIVLPEGQQKEINKAINETFSMNVTLRFEAKPDLISGIEFSAGGQKVSWTISEYLVAMEKEVIDLLLNGATPVQSQPGGPEVKPAPDVSQNPPAPKPEPQNVPVQRPVTKALS